jgi:hypothetical protein
MTRNIIGTTSAFVKKEERHMLMLNQHQDFHHTATKDLSEKLDLLSLFKVEKQLDNVALLIMNFKHIHAHVDKQEMADCFMLVQLTSAGGFKAEQLNLLEEYDSIKQVQIAKSTHFLYKYSQDCNIENLHWSHTFVKNSCPTALLQKIEEKLDLVPTNKHVGPMFFYQMMQILSAMSGKDKRSLITCLKKLLLCQFDGKDVNKATAVILGAGKILGWLAQYQKALPKLS